jgi:hypothetical protein
LSASRLVLVVLAVLMVPAGIAEARTKPKAKPKPVKISVTLTGPAAGVLVPWYGASPVFQWQVKSSNPRQQGTIWLEVSTTRAFGQEVLQQFDCGYTPGPCASTYRWKNSQPYWYDLADSCADLPPSGSCASPTSVFYWRVRFEPAGTAKKISSPVQSFRRTPPTDRRAPVAKAVAGNASYGTPTRFYYYAHDNSGVTRTELELYDGDTVVYGARGNWDRSNDSNERYIAVVLPTAVQAGSYRWCVTVSDYSGNDTTGCAPYTITS